MATRTRKFSGWIPAMILLTTILGSEVQAGNGLATEGNVLLPNPYPDPANSYFGFRIASGDFDADGIDDLVISELASSERMRIYFGKSYPIGGPYPLSRFESTTVTTPGYGSIIATGDFNGDGTDEIALGDRNSQNSTNLGGAVFIMQRASNGTWGQVEEIVQGLGTYNGVDEEDDNFGSELASGDFDGDGYDDLAIGVRGESIEGSPGIQSAGAAHVVYGSASGLSGTNDHVFMASTDGLDIAADNSDQYGYALAAGDFDDDGDDDLAIGVPNRLCPNGGQRSGGVVILHGSITLGLSTIDSQSFQPGQNGMLGDCTAGANFGHALDSGKVNGQAYDGLAIGAPLTNVVGVEGAGAVHLMFGTPGGLNPGGNMLITPADLAGGVPEEFGQFGNQLTIGSLRTGTRSLAISSARETVSGLVGAGALWIIHGGNGSATISSANAERWVASANLRIGPPGAEDHFGNTTAIGDFNDDGVSDLVIGAYQRASGGDPFVGGAQVLYQSEFIFTDGFDAD